MGNTNDRAARPITLRRYVWGAAAVWTIAVAAAAAWELFDEVSQVREVAQGRARSVLEKDLLFRHWVASRGGVYVPISEKTPPDPYLADVPHRDVVTAEGQRLTLVNAAYMMRQLSELPAPQHELLSHLTSLNPINPENRPDAWERVALEAVQSGQKEYSSIETVDGQRYLRLMRPLVTEERCVKCHGEAGYNVGDLRGGMSVLVPMVELEPMHRAEMARRTLSYSAVWLIGIGGIVVTSRHLRRQIERRQQVEVALQERETWGRDIAAHLPGVIYQFVLHADGSHTFPYISRGVTEIMGLTPEEVLADAATLFPGMFLEEDLEEIWDSIHESARGMTTWQMELRCRSTGGDVKWIRATSSPHALPDGGVLWNGVFLDITEHREADRKLQEAHDSLEQRVAERTAELEEANRELQKEIADRKQAEKWLLESEERFRSFFELGVVGMAIVSPEKDWEEANDRLCDILGYTEQELIGKTWADLIHPEDRQADETQFSRAAAGVIGGYSTQRRFLTKSGRTVYADLSVRCLRRPDGTVHSLVVLVQDISERRRAEEEVRAIQARLLEHQQK